MTKTNKLDEIAKLLPEGLDEQTAVRIAQLVGEKIQEEVSSVKDELVRKVVSFIRGNVEKLKEQAIKELEYENETYRNAQMFESVRAMFSVEVTANDELTATKAIVEEANELDANVAALTTELEKALVENQKLKASVNALNEHNAQLKRKAHKAINESKLNQKARLSDSALVVSKENFERKGLQLKQTKLSGAVENGNDFLTEDVINLMK